MTNRNRRVRTRRRIERDRRERNRVHSSIVLREASWLLMILIVLMLLTLVMGASNREMEARAGTVIHTRETELPALMPAAEEVETLPEETPVAEKAPDAIWITTDRTVAPDQGILMAEPVPAGEVPAYSEEDLEVLTRVLTGECQTGSWELQLAVGSVVLNRVSASEYPDTIHGVVFQHGQYACVRDGNYYRTPTDRNRQAARYLLENGSQIPESVIYQAQFRQGHGVWRKIGTEIFCYR